MLMKAKVGDWLVIRGTTIDQPDQRGLISEVHSPDGSPPYVVRWLENDHVATVFREMKRFVRQPPLQYARDESQARSSAPPADAVEREDLQAAVDIPGS